MGLDKSAINPATGKQYAINPATGNWDDTYFSTVVEPQYNQSNPQAQVEQQQKLAREAVQPAVDSLQSSIPEISKRFSTERERLESRKEPLTQRYNSLLEEITNRGKTQVDLATKAQSDALARRGVQGGSFYEQEILGATQPIRQQEQALVRDVGLNREEGYRQIEDLVAALTGQEVTETRGVQNAIAQLQAGAGQSGIANALTQQQLAQSASQAAAAQALQQQQLDEQRRQASVAEQMQQLIYQNINLPTAQILNSSSGAGTNKPSLQDIFGGL